MYYLPIRVRDVSMVTATYYILLPFAYFFSSLSEELVQAVHF